MITPVTMKIPKYPVPIMGRASRSRSTRIALPSDSSIDQGQDQAAGDNRGDLAGNVDADGMHQQEVGIVLGQAHLVNHPGGHGEGGDTGGADHGVDLGLGKQVHELGNHDAAEGIEDEGHQAQADDDDGVQLQEVGALHLGGDGDAQENGNQVGQGILGGIGDGVHHAALPDQVAEHQEADQGHRVGGHQAHDHRHHNGEQDLRQLGHRLAGVLHLDPALGLGGAQLDDGRLDQGHQGHVGVGRHHNGAQVLRAQLGGHEDGGGAVRRADDGDGGGVLQLEAQQRGQGQGEENAELGRRAEDHQLGIGEQGLEVDHGADADEQHQREQLGALNADAEQRLQHMLDAGAFHRHRQVDQDGAEAHGQQQRRLHLLGDGQVNQHAADNPHHQVLPFDVLEVHQQHTQILK